MDEPASTSLTATNSLSKLNAGSKFQVSSITSPEGFNPYIEIPILTRFPSKFGCHRAVAELA